MKYNFIINQICSSEQHWQIRVGVGFISETTTFSGCILHDRSAFYSPGAGMGTTGKLGGEALFTRSLSFSPTSLSNTWIQPPKQKAPLGYVQFSNTNIFWKYFSMYFLFFLCQDWAVGNFKTKCFITFNVLLFWVLISFLILEVKNNVIS